MPAHLLRQRLEQGTHLVGQHARHEPLGARGIDLVQGIQRHGEGHAVIVCARRKMVARLESHTPQHHARREIAVIHALGLLAHQQIAGQAQELRRLTTGLAPPAFELRAARHVLGHMRIEPVEEKLFID